MVLGLSKLLLFYNDDDDDDDDGYDVISLQSQPFLQLDLPNTTDIACFCFCNICFFKRKQKIFIKHINV